MPDDARRVQTRELLVQQLRIAEQAERRYRRLFEEAPVMYVITRNRGGAPIIEDCNGGFAETLGLPRERLLGRPLAEFYSPRSRAELLEEGGYQRALDGSFEAAERELVTADGRVVSTLLHAVPERDEDGQVFGTRAMYVDISERRRAELALRRSEERYRALFEESKDSLFESTPDGRLLNANPAAVELFGFPSAEELLRTNARFLYVDAAERDGVLARLDEEGFVRDYELHLRTREGRALTVLETSSAVRDEQGRMRSIRGILRDVTEARRLEEQFRQAQKLEAVGQLAGGVAHDFNNLLTAVTGYAELALERVPAAQAALRQELSEILRAGERASELTRQLLAFSRRQVLAPRLLDLNEVIAGMEKLLERTLGEHVELVTALAPGLGRIRADPGQIEQVVMNLAINARDAMPGGGHLRFATANAELGEADARRHPGLKPGPFVRMEIRDTGCGMDEATRGRLFEPFFTTKGPGKGTGLGLATVYGIVRQSGGQIRVDSEPGRGATFQIYLPRVEDAGPTWRRAESPPPKLVGGRETILVVEDDPSLRALAERILARHGFRVLVAGDPVEALRLCREREAPDLLLTDVVMPKMSGVELARQVTAGSPATRVALMSGYADRSVREDDEPLALLEKPFTVAGLLEFVRRVLDARQEPTPSA